ncbi:MAG: HNH endonuclease [Ignavibacteriae bacterium]|nr:HNH endonuclease [Ignavibacteriota bacterium]
MAKERIKIKQPMKVRSILQKEINSICPFCDSTEVEYFEIHHIDEDPSNNEIENLLLICPTHHSKITKGDISKEIVERTKKSLPIKLQIEVASISIDHNNCSWVSYDDVKHAFYQRGNEPSPFPIICFSLINHSPKTILFTEIELKEQYRI